MRSHLFHMLIYSSGVAWFLAQLVRSSRRERIRLGTTLWLAMVGGAIVLAWVMYPFPD